MQQYLDLVQRIWENGIKTPDRTGVGIRSLFGERFVHDLSEGFPIVTTKFIHLRSVIHELLWFIKGSTNIKDLHAHNVTIWDEWAGEDGELGPVYGKQWRSWESEPNDVDQLASLIHNLRFDPFSRRHIISAWNVGNIHNGDRSGRHPALPPCHILMQFHVENTPQKKLNLQVYQRSADVFLGVPFNISSYAILLSMIAQVTEYTPGRLIYVFGDAHLYDNHSTQTQEILTRTPYPLPQLELDPNIRTIDDFRYEHIVIKNYQHHPRIPAPIAV